MKRKVVLTDHPWADVDIERSIIEEAGFDLVSGPVEAGSAAEVEQLVRQANPIAIMTCWAPVSAKAIGMPRELAIVARMGVGLDNIDVAAASARGAWVTNVPDYCITEVADHAIALLLAAERCVVATDRDVRRRGWHVPAAVPRRIGDLVVSVIGYGRIGRATAARLQVLGCDVLAFDPYAKDPQQWVELVNLPTIQQRSDVIILHAPLTAETSHLVDAAFLGGCSRRPLIINVSRGGLIDNEALLAALNSHAIRGAALDVIEGEPTPPEALLDRPDVIVTPHIAYLSAASLRDLRRSACEDVVRVLTGGPPKNGRNAEQRAAIVPLTGGVSSDIFVLADPAGEIVVKTALPELRVDSLWTSRPERSGVEVRAIRAAAELIGANAVPEIVWVKPEQHQFAMRRVDQRLRNWKDELLAGQIDLLAASRAGELLAQLHARAASRDDLKREFADRSFFEELRLIPFFDRVGERMPHLAAAIREVRDALADRATTLVHGDFSPKNILADGADMVVLDYEVAHWGDPQFDVAFCVSHFVLKSLRGDADRDALEGAVGTFLDSYRSADGPAPDDRDLVMLTGCLILARTDGTSAVDYLSESETSVARQLGETMLSKGPLSIAGYLAGSKVTA